MRRSVGTSLVCLALAASPAAANFESPNPGPDTSLSPFNLSSYQVSLRATFGYDSNVLLVPDKPPFFIFEKGPVDSLFSGLTFNASGRLQLTDDFTIGGALRIDGTAYTRNGPPKNHPTEYNFIEFTPTVFGEYSFKIGDAPSKLTAGYAYLRDAGILDAMGLISHQFREQLDVQVEPEFGLYLQSLQSFDNYDVRFPGDPDDDRDAHYFSVTGGGRWYFDGHRRSLGFSFGYATNNAKGKNWDYSGFNVGGELRSHLFDRFYGALGVTYDDWHYNNSFANLFVPVPRRLERMTVFDAQLLYPISRRFLADLYVEHTLIASNNDAYAGKDTRVGVGLTVQLP